MPKPAHSEIEMLLRTLVLPFYHIQRDMPLPLGERRWENDAEHSWSIAMLGCAIAPEIDQSLDVGKICQFATVHDLVEVYANDTSVFDIEGMTSKVAREEEAFKKIAHNFARFPWIARTIEEYERKDSPEAKFVYALDKYIALAYDYIDEGKLFRERKVTLQEHNQSLKIHRTKAQSHPVIGEYYDKVRDLLNAHPEYFHPEDSQVKSTS